MVKSYPETRDPHNHDNEFYSKNNNSWDLSGGNNETFWIGGHFKAPNLSNGFHGILTQYWEYYSKQNFGNNEINVLLVSENKNVKNIFKSIYPNWNIDIIDLYPELQIENDNSIIKGDICSFKNPLETNKYHIIIAQAILEHVYNPFQAMYNFSNSLTTNGILVVHTHPPGFGYHRYPCDYIRFMKDWWYDIGKYIDNLELLELFQKNNIHVFSCYQKINNS